jgi:hypothetical protein
MIMMLMMMMMGWGMRYEVLHCVDLARLALATKIRSGSCCSR